MTEFDTYTASFERHRQATRKANELNKPTLFDALAAAGITDITVWTWSDESVHIWELVAPHHPSRSFDFKGLARGQFHISSCSFFSLSLYFQSVTSARMVWRSRFPNMYTFM